MERPIEGVSLSVHRKAQQHRRPPVTFRRNHDRSGSQPHQLFKDPLGLNDDELLMVAPDRTEPGRVGVLTESMVASSHRMCRHDVRMRQYRLIAAMRQNRLITARRPERRP